MSSAEIVTGILHIVIVAGLLMLMWRFGFFVQMYWELIEPGYKAMRQFMGQVVISAGFSVAKIGARISGVYRVKIELKQPKKLEMSYD